ncbi:hypothetical protein VOLCADRAFT_98909 [Volvox carteri f. nagariensis]|uniref:TLC domain-containing protein n=1 Tax=Volvox carteri f. nagariensis TaxID=3068 RepID=D8UGK7_VOLCA|nr:uncharacterized protein VOLCADRAFT_98909 [Volvox carteri f. nagariensis]EFJ41140.1 hypothetical protein VOLCADRAFT_98909 [Volvox carteri f. nagariensis]|eukprot:XP_002957812.1 hypothetical protein VOLCADRAFT_98909 [Volvox carteri f. nagariensis]
MGLQLLYEELDRLANGISKVADPFLDKIAPRRTIQRAYVAIAAIGILFWLVEALLLLLLTPLLVKLLRQPPSGKADAKTQLKKAKGAATQAVARLVGSIHNSIQVPVGLLILMEASFQSDRVYANSSLSYAMCYLSAGYFLHDLIMCAMRFALEGPLYTIHALACHLAYTFGAVTGFLHFHGAAFLMWEISTPFVHFRWLMYKIGMANSVLYLVNGLLMIVAFFGCRNVWGYFQSYILVSDVVRERYRPDSPFPAAATVGYCFVAVVMNTLNTYWFVKMVAAAMAVFLKGKKGGEVGSHKDE